VLRRHVQEREARSPEAETLIRPGKVKGECPVKVLVETEVQGKRFLLRKPEPDMTHWEHPSIDKVGKETMKIQPVSADF
jgi:hypothetical protein